MAGATVARGEVENLPLGAELKLAAIVVLGEWVRDDHYRSAGGPIGPGGLAGVPTELVDLDVAVLVREVNVEAPGVRVVAGEGHGEESLLAARARLSGREHD